MTGEGMIAHSEDRESALAFVIACQQDPATSTAFLGEEPVGIESELEGLDQPWLRSWCGVFSGGEIVAAATVEWDPEPSMAWIHGPWGAPTLVARHGEALVAEISRQLPADITHLEMRGHLANTAMASLADRLGWTATEVNYALVISATQVRSWAIPDASPTSRVRIRRMAPGSWSAMRRAHCRTTGRPTWTSRRWSRQPAGRGWAVGWSSRWPTSCWRPAHPNTSTSPSENPGPRPTRCTSPWGCGRTRRCAAIGARGQSVRGRCNPRSPAPRGHR